MLFCIFKFNIKTNKMNNIKDIIIGIFAVIGFAAIVTGFTNETSDQQTPESHVWVGYVNESGFMTLNKKTGEIRKMNNYSLTNSGKNNGKYIEVVKQE